MSAVAPVLFKSGVLTAPALSGQTGKLLDVLDHCLIIGTVFAYDGSSYTDRSVEARTNGGTAFPLLPDGDTGDICYFGLSQKFKHLRFDLDIVAVGGTWVWEYWNGSSWAMLTVTDNTSSFTADGTVLWTAPADWASTAVNSITQYWVRVRASGAPSTNPTVFSVTAMGWLRYTSPDPGTNSAVYRQGGGNQFYLYVEDNGAPTDARWARTRGYEDWVGGTGLFPTVAQVADPCVRKSATLDAAARAWKVLCDDRTVYLFFITGDSASRYFGWGFGDFYSYVPGDSYRTFLISRFTATNPTFNGQWGRLVMLGGATGALQGHFLARPSTGLGGSKIFYKGTDAGKGGGDVSTSETRGWAGQMPVFNGPDGGLYMGEVWIGEDAVSVRGRLRGLWCPLHPQTFCVDGDVWAGVGAFAGRAFHAIQPGAGWATAVNLGVYVGETSDSWDTN